MRCLTFLCGILLAIISACLAASPEQGTCFQSSDLAPQSGQVTFNTAEGTQALVKPWLWSSDGITNNFEIVNKTWSGTAEDCCAECCNRVSSLGMPCALAVYSSKYQMCGILFEKLLDKWKTAPATGYSILSSCGAPFPPGIVADMPQPPDDPPAMSPPAIAAFPVMPPPLPSNSTPPPLYSSIGTDAPPPSPIILETVPTPASPPLPISAANRLVSATLAAATGFAALALAL